jgi:ATP-binding cassette subfamily B protein
VTLREKVRYVFEAWRPHKRWLLLLGAFTVVSGGVTLVYPLVLESTIDAAVDSMRARGAAGVGARIFFVLGLVWLGRFVAGFYPALRAYMNLRFESAIRSEAFARVLEKDYRFQRAFRTGDLVTRLTDDIGEYLKIAWFLCSGIFRAIDSGAKALLSAGAMVLLEPRLAAISIAPLPLMIYAFHIVRRRLTEAIERQQRAISRTNDQLEAAFSGIKIVKAFSAEDGQRRKLAEILDGRIGAQIGVVRLSLLLQAADALAARAGQAIALAFGGVLVARGELAFGTLYAFYVYLDMLVHPLQDLPVLFVSARQAFVSVRRIEEVRRFPAERISGTEARPAPLAGEEFSLENVSFTYEGAPRPALDGVSLTVRRGERVAVVGAVGSGKSTLAKVLAGLLSPERGEVRADGRPAREIGWRALRERLGYVPQEPHLFSMTLRENVALGALEGERAGAVAGALAIAQLEEDLARLPAGAETPVGEKGGSISGGQRQRVAIARALARRPALLILDDATAALDARNEERFWTALDRALPEVATLVVTNRVATLRRATRVVFLDRGRIVAEGPHVALAARSPAYRELLALESRAEQLAARVG